MQRMAYFLKITTRESAYARTIIQHQIKVS